MKTLAITGGTGFVGSAVLNAALAAGHQVRALARRPQAPREGVTWIAGDLASASALADLCEGADAVIPIAVIAAMRAKKCKRLVFVSSLSAREPQLSAYGASKARAEQVVEGSGLDWTTVRPPAVYGPRDIDMLELFRTAKWGVVPLPPGGATSIIHADDLADLLVTLGASNAAPTRKKTYEPDDGREGGWSHKELAQAIGRAMGKASVFAPHLPAGVLIAAAAGDRFLRGDRAKLTADRVGYMCHPNWVSRSHYRPPPGIWQPRISGDEGLRATAEWYKREGWV